MPYTITLTDGATLTTIADNTVDNTTSLTLVGRNYSGYGAYIAEDLVHLLENAANISPPSAPLVGQLWFNTSVLSLFAWNGTSWIPIGFPASQVDLSLYVSTVGNDSNNGLTSGTAFATLQRAWDYIVTSINMNNYSVLVNIADGTYTTPVVFTGYPIGYGPGSTIEFRGNMSLPGNVIVSITNGPAIYASDSVPVYISGITIAATGTPGDYEGNGYGILITTATIIVNAVSFSTCTGGHIVVQQGGIFTTAGNPYSIVGPSPAHWIALTGASIETADSTDHYNRQCKFFRSVCRDFQCLSL